MITKRQKRKEEFLRQNGEHVKPTIGMLAGLELTATKNILNFLVFRFNRYMKRMFNNQNKTDLRSVESILYSFLFGTKQSRSDVPPNTNRTVFCMWTHIDLSLKSCYQLDQEEDLSQEQLLLLCSSLRNFSSINFQGHVHLNDYCVSVLMRNNPMIQFLDLQATQVDYEGIKSILLQKEDKKLKHTHHVHTLKLSRLSRAPLTEANVNIFKYCNSLTHLELSNNGLHQNEVKKLICFQPNEEAADDSIVRDNLSATMSFKNFTFLNLSCNSITDEGAKILSMCSSLKTLVLEDCGIGNDGIKHLLESGTAPHHQLTNLTELNVSHNKAISDDGLELVATHKTLKKLVLSDTVVGDVSAGYISQSTTLQEVELDHTKLGNPGITKILLGIDAAPKEENKDVKPEIRSVVMQTLVRLNIRFTQVTRDEVTKIHQIIRQYQQQQLEQTGKSAYSQFKYLIL